MCIEVLIGRNSRSSHNDDICISESHLIEAITASLCEEGLHVGVTQDIVLGCPLDDFHVAANWQAVITNLN